MHWFTHYTRPMRKGLPPGGRNHFRCSPLRTQCGVRLQPWLKNQTVIIDALTRRPAYPTCKRCDRLRPVLRAEEGPRRDALPAWPVLG